MPNFIKKFLESFRTYFMLLAFAKPYKKRLIVGILAGFLSGGSLIGILYYSPDVIRAFEIGKPDVELKQDDAGAQSNVDKIATRLNIQTTKPDGGMSWQFMLLSVIGLPICILLKTSLTYINRYCMRWVGARVIVDLRKKIFSSLLRQSLRYHGKSDCGKLISRCFADTAAVQHAIAASIADLSRD